MKSTLQAIMLICSATVAFAQQNWDSVKISAQSVRENIYMLRGAGGNIGVLTGTDGILMIDDQFLPLGPRIAQAIASLDAGPIRYTINTHIHGDHSGGNEFFKQQGSTVVAHANVRQRMMKESINTRTNATIPPRHEDAWPVISFPQTMSIHLNGQDIHLMYFGPGHTDGDVIVRFSDANVFHMGDLFVTYGYPYIDMSNGGNINGMIDGLDQALKLMNEETIVIPGHGELSRKGDVQKFRDRLADIRDNVSAALKRGTKKEDLASLDIATKYDAEWGKGFVKGKDFVLIVAEGLTAGQ